MRKCKIHCTHIHQVNIICFRKVCYDCTIMHVSFACLILVRLHDESYSTTAYIMQVPFSYLTFVMPLYICLFYKYVCLQDMTLHWDCHFKKNTNVHLFMPKRHYFDCSLDCNVQHCSSPETTHISFCMYYARA